MGSGDDGVTLAVETAADMAALRHTVVTLRRIVIFMLIAGIFALALGMTWIYVQSYQGRKEVVATQRLGCIRGLLDRSDAIGDQEDEATFRRAAAAARERGGTDNDQRAAKRYRRLADRAQDRADSRRHRLLGARYEIVVERIPRGSRGAGDPTPAALAEAKAACGRAYPAASPWPWAHPQAS